MNAAKPLTVKEKRQLDAWNANGDRAMRRGYLVTVVLGFLGGVWLDGSFSSDASDVTFDGPSFLLPVADALGHKLAAMLFWGLLFAGAMLLVMWRIARSMRATNAQYQARYLAAGVEGEPPRASPST